MLCVTVRHFSVRTRYLKTYLQIPQYRLTKNTLFCNYLIFLSLTTYIYIYICRNAALTSRRYILNIYSTNIHTEYFKHAA